MSYDPVSHVCPWSIINIENSCAAFNIFVETFIYLFIYLTLTFEQFVQAVCVLTENQTINLS